MDHVTTPVIDALSNSFTQTSTMRELDLLRWPNKVKKLFFMSDTLEISEEMLEGMLKKKVKKGKEDTMMKKTVIVELLDLRWFFNHRKNFIGFSTILAKMPPSFYSSTFTTTLLDQFWDDA